MFYFRNGNILVQTFKAQAAVLLTQSDKQNVFQGMSSEKILRQISKKLLSGIYENKN